MGRLLRSRKKGKKAMRHKTRARELEWMDLDGEEYEDEEYESDEYEDEEYEDEYYESDEYEDEAYEDGEYESDEYGDEVYEDDEYESDEYEDEAYEDEEYESDEYGDEAYEDGEYESDEYEDEAYEDGEYESDEYGDEEYEDEEYEDEYYESDEYEDEEYEDDEYEEEEYDYEDYEDDEVPDGGIKKVIYKITHMSSVDYIVSLTGAAVLVMAVITGVLYANAKEEKAQIEAFAEIGVGLEDISMIGEGGLLAVADAQAARAMTAAAVEEMEQQEEQEEQEEEKSGDKEAVLNLSSIQKDLKIKFLNKESGKLIPSVPFEVEIEKPSGGTYTKKDEDMDGIIYQKDMEPGRYKVKIIAPEKGEYGFSGEAMAITVRDTIEYKKVDIADEVKTEAQVNAAAEDTKVNETVVESVNNDTVEWVESTKTLIEGTESSEEQYEAVDRGKIPDPEQKAWAGFRLLAAENEPMTLTEGGDPSQTPDETQAPSDSTNSPEPTNSPVPSEMPTPTETPVPPTPEPTPTPTPSAEPTQSPAPTQVPVPTATATPVPTATATPTPTPIPTGTPTPTATTSPTVSPSPTASASASPTATAADPRKDTTSTLKNKDGETLYVKDGDGKFREAKFADYYNTDIKEFYRLTSKITGKYRYTGWQEIDGKTYFFDKNGNAVTGEQTIQGAKYNFNSDGSLNTGSGHLGIDVSKWNGNIDWNAVKNSGVSYVIIRCGYRGSSTGALIEDPKFRSNIQGASKAGLKVGIYFFTQAVNEVEAVEEASMVLGLIKGYNISYPVFLDVESSNGGRGDGINASTRTAVCKAFCQTIQNSGYKAGIYANKTWLNSYLDAPSLSGYKIWLAQYAAAPTYSRTKYDMWQYSSKGKVAGISGDVDMNISYMGY